MNKLKAMIGKKALFFVTVNAILGTGIFFLPALGALYAGSASILSWLIMSIVAVFISMYFAELISMFPKSGGVYEYTRRAFGDFPSFIFGWMAWIVANITIAMLVVGSLVYLLPNQPFIFNIILSIAFILFFNFVSYRGIDWSSKMLVFFGILTIASLLVIIIPGIFTINTSNFSGIFSSEPFMLLLAVYFIAETFFGWETTTYLTEEVKNGRKVVPKTLVITTAFIAVISLLLVFVALGNANASLFGLQTAPLSFLASKFFGPVFAGIFTILIFIPLIGTAASWIVASPRLLFAMSREKALPKYFQSIHKKYRTPHKAILFQSIVTVFVTIIALGEFYLLLSLLIPVVVLMYSAVMLAVVKLRIDEPRRKRLFKAPFGEIGPVVITGFLLLLLAIWLEQIKDATPVFLLGIILAMIGMPLYILIKLQTDERFTEKFFDRLSLFWDKTFPLWYGKSDVARVVSKLNIQKKSVVLDFGCGSGITTVALAKKASQGLIVGVDISEKQLEHAVDKLKRMNLSNVILVKKYGMRFKKNSFDAIAAVGVFEYLDKPKASIRKMMSYLKPHGRFSFLSFGKSLGIAAPEHLSNEENIRKLFKGLNVELHIKKEKKKMAEYWFIWGRKK